ncbi:PIN domain-containing protein [Acrocarpospora sp. B8E8]|uniref:PIN domain-containing protein n=1 Tax=Acrocarpospora sp. B8E8 TaxID=3153572 RepID=UPI00325DCC9E
MLQLLIDTSVWLDLAKRRDGQKWIVPLRVLKFQGKIDLLVPRLVIAEFERNRPRAEAAVTASVRERFRLLRNDLQEYGDDDRHTWLAELTHRIPLLSAMTLQNFSEISDLLHDARSIEPTDLEYARIVQRGLDKKAPFHLHKNSIADALLIEVYRSAADSDNDVANHYCFVTSNYQDFSLPNGDRRTPHPDLAVLFPNERSRYLYGVEGLNSALVDHLGEEFIELSNETEFLQEEPRTFAEILEAEREYFDKIWYVRSLIRAEKIEAGEREGISPELTEQIHASMRVIEERYGAENVGPWDDWGWGFVHGKLSALRWVLGSEWDFLDT